METITKLKDFGLTEEEARIYVCLADGQSKTVVELSRQTAIPRASIYDNLTKLSDKGLVETVVGHKTRFIKIAPLSMLDLLIEKRRAEAEDLEKNLVSLKEELKFPLMTGIVTKVKYYHGASGLQQMMWNALSAQKETVGYSEFGRIEIVGQKFLQKWVDQFHAKELSDRVITNRRPETLRYIGQYVKPKKHQLSLSDIRILPERRAYITGDTTIYNDTFAVCYWRSGEVIGFEIENKEFVRTQKTIFETLWKQAKPIRKG